MGRPLRVSVFALAFASTLFASVWLPQASARDPCHTATIGVGGGGRCTDGCSGVTLLALSRGDCTAGPGGAGCDGTTIIVDAADGCQGGYGGGTGCNGRTLIIEGTNDCHGGPGRDAQ